MSRFLALCLALIALIAFSAPSHAATAQELIAQGDALYAQRIDDAKAAQAVQAFENALKADPKNPEAAWKLGRALYRMGMAASKEKQVEVYGRGVEVLEKAQEYSPNSVPVHYWLGVLYGVYGSAKGVMKSLSLVDPIKEQAQFVIDKDPGYDQGGAYRLLGRLYFKLPGLFGGDNDKAMELLQKAIKMGPTRYNSHLFLAEVYLDEGMKDKAKALLETVINGPTEKGMEYETGLWKADAKKMLANM